MDIAYKQIKKVTKIRLFVFETSVYAKWQRDTPKMLNRAFELDWQFIKLFKFIKDQDDLEATKKVLKSYFLVAKEAFINQICSEKFYPVITWMEFSNAV